VDRLRRHRLPAGRQRIGYGFGDVNFDGEVDIDDISLIDLRLADPEWHPLSAFTSGNRFRLVALISRILRALLQVPRAYWISHLEGRH
jgi:hypothetical protein